MEVVVDLRNVKDGQKNRLSRHETKRTEEKGKREGKERKDQTLTIPITDLPNPM